MEQTAGHIRTENIVEKLVQSKLFWAITLLALFSYPLVRSIYRQLPEPLPVHYKVPAFELTNEFGKPFGSRQLQGKVYLASFAFTTCPSICPELMKTLQTVQKRVRGLGTKIAIVTFTVDPANDTPEVLFKHSRKWRANPHVWTFLTGEESSIRALLVNGYKVPVGEKEADLMDIAHSGKVLLVDADGDVRGHYSTDKHSIDKLMIDVGLLINRENIL